MRLSKWWEKSPPNCLVPNCPYLTPDATSLISRETWFLVNSYNDIVDDDYNDEKYYEWVQQRCIGGYNYDNTMRMITCLLENPRLWVLSKQVLSLRAHLGVENCVQLSRIIMATKSSRQLLSFYIDYGGGSLIARGGREFYTERARNKRLF